MQNRRTTRFLLLLVGFYILPPIAILLNIVPYRYRFLLLLAMPLIMIGVKLDKKSIPKDFGITTKKIRESIVSVVPATVGIILISLFFSFMKGERVDNSSLSICFYFFYIIISCPLQEFAYRGYLYRLLELLGLQKWTIVFLGASLYGFMHVIYMDIPMLLTTSIVGVVWNINYSKFRNLAGVTLSHSIIGVVSILLGLI